MKALCLHCGESCALTNSRGQPFTGRKRSKPYWTCQSCPDSRVGCHPGTTKPLGFAADRSTRRARGILHARMVDPLWKGTRNASHNRRAIYRFMSDHLGIDVDDTHIGMFDIETCREVWRLLRGKTLQEIVEWDDQKKREALDRFMARANKNQNTVHPVAKSVGKAVDKNTIVC